MSNVLVYNDIASANPNIIYAKRFGSGVPWTLQQTDSQYYAIYKGNSATPTSFSALYSSLANIRGIAQKNSTTIILTKNTASGMDNILVYDEYYENGGTPSTNNLIYTYNSVPASNVLRAYIHIDSQGDLHCFFNDNNTNMGTNYLGLYYTNNIGGSWKTPVEILGSTTETSVAGTQGFQGHLDTNDIPIVAGYTSLGTADRVFYGNQRNATSFGVFALATTSIVGKNGIFSDENGNNYIVCKKASPLTLEITKHLSTDTGWTSTIFQQFDTENYDTMLGIKQVGQTLYVIYQDDTNNAGKISVQAFDLNGTGSIIEGSVETTWFDYTFDWDAVGLSFISTIIEPHPAIASYDSAGTDQGVGDRPEIDIVYTQIDGSNYDTYWASYTFAAATNVSKIKVTSWKDWGANPQINIGGTWKAITAVKINIGGVWKDVDITP